jgi:hypothetical protein
MRIVQLYPRALANRLITPLCSSGSSSSYFATVLVSGPPSGAHDRIFITVGHLRSSCCGAPSLPRGRVCKLPVQFAVTLRSKSRRTHDHILLSRLRLLASLSRGNAFALLPSDDRFLNTSSNPAFSRKNKKKKKFRGLSVRANYTDRATAACRQSDCQLLRIEGATWSA